MLVIHTLKILNSDCLTVCLRRRNAGIRWPDGKARRGKANHDAHIRTPGEAGRGIASQRVANHVESTQ